MAMDVVDYEIKGSEMQFVEVELDPGEAAVGEAGSMMFMDAGIGMDTVFGDGARAAAGRPVRQAAGAGKRLVTGESLFTTVYTNNAAEAARRVRGALPRQDPADGPAPDGRHADLPEGRLPVRGARRVAGHRVPAEAVGGLLRRRGLHHAEARGRRPGLRACRRHRAQARTAAGQTLLVDTGCVVAYTPSVNFEIQYVGKIKTALFGGEGLFFAKLTGPGTVWLQSLPFSRLASRVFAAAPQRGGSREEGSVLGGMAGGGVLGGMIGGDDE
jgi:uncharacterized protein (AIM24 family)